MTHSFTYGQEFTETLQQQIISYIKETPFIKGITFSGGDPMSSPKDVLAFIKLVKSEVEDINLWLYTGFVFEDIVLDMDKFNILKELDVLVDGKFIWPYDPTLVFRGSKNQRIIDVPKSIELQNVHLYIV